MPNENHKAVLSCDLPPVLSMQQPTHREPAIARLRQLHGDIEDEVTTTFTPSAALIAEAQESEEFRTEPAPPPNPDEPHPETMRASFIDLTAASLEDDVEETPHTD